jgi:2,3-bisphosphoglycerate-independent phosphoglycerate mutase
MVIVRDGYGAWNCNELDLRTCLAFTETAAIG